jgi:hypothetical protein
MPSRKRLSWPIYAAVHGFHTGKNSIEDNELRTWVTNHVILYQGNHGFMIISIFLTSHEEFDTEFSDSRPVKHANSHTRIHAYAQSYAHVHACVRL